MRSEGKPHVSAAREAAAVIDAQFDEEGNQKDDTSKALTTVPPNMMQLKTEYAAAIVVAKPRILKELARKVLQEAELSGEDFFYQWTVRSKDGPKIVEGVSIDGAMILVRNWGNCALPTDMVEDSPTHWMLKATFVDLETGFTLPRLFRQRKGESHQRKQGDDADRTLDIAFQIGQSKAQRNTVTKALPAWLVNRALETAQKAAEDRYAKDLPAYIKVAIEEFGKLGVSIDQLETKLGGRPQESWSTSDVRTLKGLHRAIQGRETTIDAEFPKPGTEPTKVEPPKAEEPKAEAKPEAKPEPPKPAAAQAVPGVMSEADQKAALEEERKAAERERKR